jgi:hypothetical protein
MVADKQKRGLPGIEGRKVECPKVLVPLKVPKGLPTIDTVRQTRKLGTDVLDYVMGMQLDLHDPPLRPPGCHEHAVRVSGAEAAWYGGTKVKVGESFE